MTFRALRALLLAPALLSAALAAPAFAPGAAVAQQGPVVESVAVTGNRRIDPETVRSYLTLEPGDQVTPEALNASVRRLLETGLFQDARISLDGRRLIVQVLENPSINRIAFEGNDLVTDEELLAVIESRPRRAFTRSRAEADAQALVDLYRATGRYGAEVEPQIIELPENRVDLVFEIEEGGVTGVEAITFVGNEVYSDRRLRRVLSTKESGLFGFILSSDIYDADRLELDQELLRQFYLSRGYADFTVLSATAELGQDREDFFITFTVDEGERYEFGEQTVTTNDPALDPDLFELLIAGDPGDVYDAGVVERNIDRMIFEAGQQGFAFVEVRPQAERDVEDRRIDIVYELLEGRRVYVERIEIEGNERTLDRVIRRQFPLAEGDAFDSRALEAARRGVRGLGFFSRVDVTTEEGASPDRVVINVEVEEQPTGSLTFGAGFSSSEGVVGEVSVTERNFLGRGQLARARALIAGDTQTIDLAFREPALLDRNLTGGFNVFFRQEDRSEESSFEETNLGFVPTMAFPVSLNGFLTLEYRISRDEIREVRDDASPIIKRDEGSAVTSAIGYGYAYDRTNDPLEPTRGYVLRFTQDFAGLGGDTQFVRSVGRARGYTSAFAEDLIFSLGAEAGHIAGFGDGVRITDRFFLGGDSFRGFRPGGLGPRDDDTDDALGGQLYGVLRAEMSFPLGLPEEFGVYGGLFTDVGSLWSLEENEADGTVIDDDPKLRASIGASVFLDTGFGPLRINLATPILEAEGDEDEIFRLTAGTRF